MADAAAGARERSHTPPPTQPAPRGVAAAAPTETPAAPVGGRLAGKVAIIAGAGQMPGQTLGNGRAVALLFAREGAKLMLSDLNEDAVRATQQQVTLEFGNSCEVEICVADVSKESDCAALIAKAVERFGRVDVLHNNVGIPFGDKAATEVSLEAYERIMSVNAGGALWLIKHVLPTMRRQLCGVIINVSSIGSLLTLPQGGGGGIAYKMSKAALNTLTQNVAIENARYGIRANAVLPGLMDTPMSVERRVKAMVEAEGVSDAEARDTVRAARSQQVPLQIGGRPSMGSAWDTAHAALFLASDEARFVTGVLLCTDGGQAVSTGVPFIDRERDC